MPARRRIIAARSALRPDDPDSLNALAVFLCLQKNETTEALRYFEKALAVPLSKTYSNKAMVYTNAGVCAKRVDMDKAESYLRSALDADPNFSPALLQLADVAFSRSNYLQSRAFLERFLAASPATPDALWLGYRVENALGEASAARAYGERLKKEFPESVETRLLLESAAQCRITLTFGRRRASSHRVSGSASGCGPPARRARSPLPRSPNPCDSRRQAS